MLHSSIRSSMAAMIVLYLLPSLYAADSPPNFVIESGECLIMIYGHGDVAAAVAAGVSDLPWEALVDLFLDETLIQMATGHQPVA